MMSRRSTSSRRIAANAVAGLAAGVVAAWAMERFQYALQHLSSDVGGASGGGGQQHRQPQSEPATYKAADAVAHAATGEHLGKAEKKVGGEIVHLAFGAAIGAIYGAAAARNEEITTWMGLPFGATVWLVADELGVPLAGLSKPPTAYPARDHASALAAHLVYGAATELVRKGLTNVMRS